jgi:hypothetical protein
MSNPFECTLCRGLGFIEKERCSDCGGLGEIDAEARLHLCETRGHRWHPTEGYEDYDRTGKVVWIPANAFCEHCWNWVDEL